MEEPLNKNEEILNINAEADIVETIVVYEKPELSNLDIPDEELVNLRPFRSLTIDDNPVIPLPPDDFADQDYPKFHEPRCSICTSPYRTLAEHVYLDEGRKPQRVVNFFAKYFNAKLNWVQVQTHMEQHCNFTKISMKGIDAYDKRTKDIEKWLFREHELAMIALLVEIDDIRAIDCTKNPELKIKRSSMIERLISRMLDLKEKRDAALNDASKFNIFEVLMDIHDNMIYESDKKVIVNKVKELRDRLSSNI